MATHNPYETPQSGDSVAGKPVSYWRLWPTAVIAMVLLLASSTMGSTVFAMALTLFLVPVQATLLGVAFWWRKKNANAVRLRLTRVGIYLAMLVVMFLHANYEQTKARAQAEKMVDACHRYESDHGLLPEDLPELVPDYLPSLPEYLGVLSKKVYYYHVPRDGGNPSFMYMPEPFTRSWYNFEKRTWTSYAS